MVKITFRETFNFHAYHDLPVSWHNGDTREVAEERADYLCTEYPNHFFRVKKEKTTAKAEPVGDLSNKAIDPKPEKGDGAEKEAPKTKDSKKGKK